MTYVDKMLSAREGMCNRRGCAHPLPPLYGTSMNPLPHRLTWLRHHLRNMFECVWPSSGIRNVKTDIEMCVCGEFDANEGNSAHAHYDRGRGTANLTKGAVAEMPREGALNLCTTNALEPRAPGSASAQHHQGQAR